MNYDIFKNSNAVQRLDVLKYMLTKNPSALANAIAVTQNQSVGEVVGATSTDVVLADAANSESWFDKILRAASTIGLVINQRDIAKINLERVKQGKEPLSTDVTGTAINLGIAAETRKTLLYVAGGLGLLLAIVLLRKKR